MVNNPFRRNSVDFHLSLNTNDHLLLKIVNVLTYCFFFSSSVYGSFWGHGSHFHGRDTYITPAGYVFQIWPLISLLLLGFVIYQFFDEAQPAVLAIGWRFAILAVLNSVFVHVWIHGQYLVAFIFAILVMLAVSAIYYLLVTNHGARTDLDSLVVHLPFSLWHAWSIVMVFIVGFATFTHGGHGHHPNVVVVVLVVLSEAFFALTALGYVFQSKKGDIAGAIVLAWTLFGIYDRQHNDLISFFALGCFIISCAAIVKALYFTFVKGDGAISLGDGERAPLIA